MLHEFSGLRAASYASAELGDFFADFFAAKNAHDLDRTMSFFSPDLRTYTDATLGWNPAGFTALRALYAQYMPTWGPNARREPTHIFGRGPRVALAFTDSPELFGAELLDPSNPTHHADRAQRLQRAAARAADPSCADRRHPAERAARAYLPAPDPKP